MNKPFLETERLTLRHFVPGDLDELYRLRSDPEVMRFFPATQTRDEIAELLPILMNRRKERGLCFAPVIERQTNRFCGFCGIEWVPDTLPCHPAIEIGWSLLPEFWGKGYASEAANAWLKWGFANLEIEEIVSFAVHNNHASLAVMRRIGMTPDPARDFDHPAVPAHRPELKHHLFHAISRERWTEIQA